MAQILMVLAFWASMPLIFCAIALGILYIHSKRAKNGDVDYSGGLSRYFAYKVMLTKDELLQKLGVPNINDPLEYELDLENSVIAFKKYNVTYEYAITVTEQDGYCIIKLRQLSSLINSGKVTAYINPFFTKKLGATPIPYSEN